VREEVNQVIHIIRTSANLKYASEDIAQKLNVSYQNAADMVAILVKAVRENPSLTAENRTSEMREALQYWGPTVRRSQNPNYWVEKAFKEALIEAKNGKLIYVTDGRFPNEVDAANKAGFITIRIETSQPERIRRIQERDGKPPEAKALVHPSETALDSYENFDLVINNDQELEKTVQMIVTYVQNKNHPQ
jgi:hypothetical protein